MRPRKGRGYTDERRKQVIGLREWGLTVREISQVLGISRQAVHYLLRQFVPCSIRCRSCQAVIYKGPRSLSGRSNVLCVSCLGRLPNVSFGARLRSARLARGLSLRRLAKESEVTVASLSKYERDATEPTWSILFQIMCVLGPEFVTAGVKQVCKPTAQTPLNGRETPPTCPGA
jgi:DNA-binding XRE family transcriptional regulator